MGSVFPIGVEAGPGICQASNDCGSLAASLQPVDSCFCLDTGQGGQQTTTGLGVKQQLYYRIAPAVICQAHCGPVRVMQARPNALFHKDAGARE